MVVLCSKCVDEFFLNISIFLLTFVINIVRNWQRFNKLSVGIESKIRQIKPTEANDYFDADVLNAQDYYPFRQIMPGRFGKVLFSGGLSSFVVGQSGNYRYGFNGKENDYEIKGFGNEQDYGMRVYDPRVARFLSVDPKASSFPWQSPYCAMDNNPINIIDPDGRSGEPVINKKNGTITVTQHLVFYGGKATSELSGKIAAGIPAQWNGAHGKVTVDGKSYKVNFKVTYETVSEADATKMASGNTDIKNNFIRVEDGSGSSFTQKLCANSYFFNTDDDIGGSTTPAHEIGHG